MKSLGGMTQSQPGRWPFWIEQPFFGIYVNVTNSCHNKDPIVFQFKQQILKVVQVFAVDRL